MRFAAGVARTGGLRRRRREVVVFGSCQGEGLARVLAHALPRRYRVRHLWNGAVRAKMRPVAEILETLSAADYAIHQPLGNAHPDIDPTEFATALGGVPEVLSFARILNDGIASMSRANEKAVEPIFGQAPVRELLERGEDVESVKGRFERGEIDFDQRGRFDRSLRRLWQQERKRGVSIRVAEFIADRHREQRLFLTHNHPTTALFAELCAQIRAQSSLPVDVERLRRCSDPNLGRLAEGGVALTPDDVTALGYRFGPGPDWRGVGRTLIDEIARAPVPAATG